MTSASALPYGRHHVVEEDIEAVVEVLRGSWLTGGPSVADFEMALAQETGSAEAVAVSSGTAALHQAVMALGLAEGEAAIVPTITFLATANAVRYVGAEVVFADVDENTGLMGVEQFESACERAADHGLQPKLVLPVHLAGQCSDPAGLAEAAAERGLTVLEDACHALGTAYRAAGTDYRSGACAHSAAATFSFHPVKTIAMGEGGAVTTNDPEMAHRLRRLRNHGMTREPERFQVTAEAFDAAGLAHPWYYEMHDLGHNHRASDIHCALGLSQLRSLASRTQRRTELVMRYVDRLATLAPVVRPLQQVPGCAPCWHLFVALIDYEALGRSRADVMRQLQERGVQTQVHYIPVHMQPYYRSRYGELGLPGAAAYYAKALTLPLFPQMEEDDVDEVVSSLQSVLGL